MDLLFRDFGRAFKSGSGYQLAATLSPVAPTDHKTYLTEVWESTTLNNARNDIRRAIDSNSTRSQVDSDKAKGWADVYFAYWKALGDILAAGGRARSASWTKAYEAWKELALALYRGYTNHNFEAWTIPCLYVVGKHLKLFAIKADAERVSAPAEAAGPSFQEELDPEMEEHKSLRDCEQQLKRLFMLCLGDRSPVEESRKWGIYAIINLLFKTYFKLNSAFMSRTILKTLSAYTGDMPPLESFPRSHRVTFKYYEGVLFFLEENYTEADKALEQAWGLCHKDAIRNKERILTYLIPCRQLTMHTLPTAELLAPYPRLQELFAPLSEAIRYGRLKKFDDALQAHADDFVRLRIYLALERGRDVAMRNLLRRVFVAGGFVEGKDGGPPIRRTRLPVSEFTAAVTAAGSQPPMDNDEMECILANMIYKGLMKGYISRDHGMVVFSKSGAFPGTGV